MKTFISKYFFKGLLAAAGITLSLSSCKKYLELEPVSSFGPDYVFGNAVNAESAVLGAYACLGGDQGYGIRLNLYYAYDNDEMMGQGGTPYPDNERRDISHFNAQPSNTQLASPFSQLFRGIERANICIYNIPKMDLYTTGPDGTKNQLRRLYGEALALRAQFYFEAIRNWGDLPYHFQPASFETDLFKTKTDRDTIYNTILRDLAEAASLVPWRTQAGVTNERLTQGAIRGLRARIALFRGGYSLRSKKSSYGGIMARPTDYKNYYQIAKDECTIIMQHTADHSLNPSYKAVFKDLIGARTADATGEILWEIGMSGSSSNFGDSKLGYYNGPQYNGTGNGALSILPSYFYLFDSTDLRRDVTCAPYNIATSLNLTATTLQGMRDGKFRRDWNPVTTSAAQYFGTNWPILRYSDVLLMFAEADNELGNAPSAAAKTAFEQVRLRGYGGNAALIGTTPGDYAGFFNAIMKERSLELGGEGIRKYDLIRWNKLAERITATKAQLLAMSNRAAPYDQLPVTMYYTPNLPVLTWVNSFYYPSPLVAPTGATAVSWISTAINTTILTYYAAAFAPNKKELLPFPQSVIDVNPNLEQNDY